MQEALETVGYGGVYVGEERYVSGDGESMAERMKEVMATRGGSSSE